MRLYGKNANYNDVHFVVRQCFNHRKISPQRRGGNALISNPRANTSNNSRRDKTRPDYWNHQLWPIYNDR